MKTSDHRSMVIVYSRAALELFAAAASAEWIDGEPTPFLAQRFLVAR